MLAFSRFANVWTKLRAFELAEYDRVILIDSDMLVRQNMDELMTFPLPTPMSIAAGFACTCNPNHIPTYPADWTAANCAYTLQHNTTHTNEGAEIAEDAPRTHHLLNSGLVVIDPSPAHVEAIATHLVTHHDRVGEYRFPDQDLLADVYHERFVPLSWRYNALKTLRYCHPDLWRDADVCNVHYILDKPWRTGWPKEDDVDKNTHTWWWDAFHALQTDPKRIGLTPVEWHEWIANGVYDGPQSGL